MSSLVFLAAAPDAIAPIKASVLALAAFLIIIPISLHGERPANKQPKPVAADSDQPLEDQVGA